MTALVASFLWTEVPQARAAGSSTIDYAPYLNGANYFTVGENNVFDPTGNFTFSAWIKPDGSQSWGMIVNKETNWELAINGVELQYAIANSGGGWAFYATGVTVRSGAWQHISVAVSRSTTATSSMGTHRAREYPPAWMALPMITCPANATTGKAPSTSNPPSRPPRL